MTIFRLHEVLGGGELSTIFRLHEVLGGKNIYILSTIFRLHEVLGKKLSTMLRSLAADEGNCRGD